MTDWTKYSDKELERLTTLTEATAKPGEFVRRMSSTFYRTTERIVSRLGLERCPVSNAHGFYDKSPYERRVVSFTDATELDPPQADMLAELARRKAPVFKVGELVMCGGEISKVVPVPEKFCNDAWANERQIVWMEGDPNSPLGWEYRDKLRPATDAETAAYHRAHCQPKVEPAPVVISNATHAGQWVKWLGRPCKVLSITNLVFTPACGLIAVADEDGCVCHIRPNEAILIDPPTWPQ